MTVSNAPKLAKSVNFDFQTFGKMSFTTLSGVAWATYNYFSTHGMRGEDQLRPLVWAIFAIPLTLFLGWLFARRNELGNAALACFCLYFFTPFVAARLESLLISADQAARNGHNLYFIAVIGLQTLGAFALILWQAGKSCISHQPVKMTG